MPKPSPPSLRKSFYERKFTGKQRFRRKFSEKSNKLRMKGIHSYAINTIRTGLGMEPILMDEVAPIRLWHYCIHSFSIYRLSHETDELDNFRLHLLSYYSNSIYYY